LKYKVLYFGTQVELGVYTPRERELAKLMPIPKKLDTANFLRSPMPGSVVSINVKPGDKIVLGQVMQLFVGLELDIDNSILFCNRNSLLLKP